MGVFIKLFEFREKSEDSLPYRCRSLENVFFFSVTRLITVLERNKNKANKIDATYSAARLYKGTGRDICIY